MDLGSVHVQGLHHRQQPANHSRNGPARQRRTEKRAAAHKAQAEEAEAALTEEEREVWEMAERAKSISPVQEAFVPAQGKNKLEEEKAVAVEKVNKLATKTAGIEVVDEVCADTEYESRLSDEPKDKPKSTEVTINLPKSPPVIDRSLGGIDYYTATYEDPSSDGYDYYFFARYILFSMNNLFF